MRALVNWMSSSWWNGGDLVQQLHVDQRLHGANRDELRIFHYKVRHMRRRMTAPCLRIQRVTAFNKPPSIMDNSKPETIETTDSCARFARTVVCQYPLRIR